MSWLNLSRNDLVLNLSQSTEASFLEEEASSGPGGNFRIGPRALYLFQHITIKRRRKRQGKRGGEEGHGIIVDLGEACTIRLRDYLGTDGEVEQLDRQLHRITPSPRSNPRPPPSSTSSSLSHHGSPSRPFSTLPLLRGHHHRIYPTTHHHRRQAETSKESVERDHLLRMGGKREKKREQERAFQKNGGMLLEKLVATCNGKPPIPIRNFSENDLISATNNYDPRLVLHNYRFCKWYKGSLEGRTISIRKTKGKLDLDCVFTEIAISAKMSAHKNVLRLVGCCLETQVPIVVYESIEEGTLYNQILGSNSNTSPHQRMAWQSKLKVASEISHAVAYLHTAFSRPILHRCINLTNIFFAEHEVPKLSYFLFSITIPEGETHANDETLCGTPGFMCPNYVETLRVTEKSDVYSFGALLLVLLTELLAYDTCLETEDLDIVKYVRKHGIHEIVDPAIIAREGATVLDLALACTEDNPEDRPTMVDVSRELRRIERIVRP
ncbi:serine/threonine-protein kinase ZRK1-like [Corylus avellana]|uniref:serine/threonine-protein kinase ZRK1-like n=1 Tax=Corylus avellana TaxID=13451 RepID=UPI00286D24C3|nr:serine/threonine-protein kinase ZRK1-like [Corylus avellana]